MKQYIKDMTPEEVIQKLKQGEILYPGNPDYYYKMIAGVLCEFFNDELHFINVQVGSVYRPDSNEGFDYYFETKEPFKITESGFYKTKDERKIYISWVNDCDIYGRNLSEEDCICYGLFASSGNVCTWDIFGKSITYAYGNNDGTADIISKWKD